MGKAKAVKEGIGVIGDAIGGAAAAIGLGSALAPQEAEAVPLKVLSHIDDAGKKVYKTVIEAFHGSPHKFDKFSMDQIGTGEGAQAYGHGLYFADSEDVARGYRERLSKSEFIPLIDGDEPSGAELIAATQILDSGNDYDGLLAEIKDISANYPDEAPNYMDILLGNAADLPKSDKIPDNLTPEEYIDVLEGMAGKRVSWGKKKGHMYRATLDVDPDELLDYDLPLSEQSDVIDRLGIREDMDKYLVNDAELGELMRNNGLDTPRWNELVEESRELRRKMGVDPHGKGSELLGSMKGRTNAEGAVLRPEEALRDSGIPGLRYRDAMSRSQTPDVPDYETWRGYNKGGAPDSPEMREEYAGVLQQAKDFEDSKTYNYVMFGDEPISIKERGNVDPMVLASLATTSIAAGEFARRRQEKRSQWEGLRMDLMNSVSAAANFTFDALEIPMRGIHGLTATAGSLAAGNDLQSALMRGGHVAGQPIQATAQELGDATFEKTGSPALSAGVYGATQMADIF